MLIRKLLVIILLSGSFPVFTQEKSDSLSDKKKEDDYFAKEEIIYDGKRYRLHNNYLTAGGGYMISSLRQDAQANVGADFHFHIRRHYMQIGVVMSGDAFLSNNNVQGHLGYGWRRERNNSNIALYGGLTLFYGVIGIPDSAFGFIPRYYNGAGLYACAQFVTKLTYDIGIGVEGFAEYNQEQYIVGFRFIAFFSGAYRGPKKNVNPNVRSERRP